MADLPIAVETAAWPWMLFGAPCIGISIFFGYLAIKIRSEDHAANVLGFAPMVLVSLLLGVAVSVRHVGWELRLDQKSIALHAPFELIYRGAEIAWPDVTSVDFIDVGTRGPAPFLRVRGRGGTMIRVANPDGLPQELYVALQKTLAERAPQVDLKVLNGWLKAPRRKPEISANIYWARDAHGKALH